jgi:integrase
VGIHLIADLLQQGRLVVPGALVRVLIVQVFGGAGGLPLLVVVLVQGLVEREPLSGRRAEPGQRQLPWEEPGGEPVTAELILVSVTGKAMNRNTFNTYGWKPALEAAGIPASRANGCHALRHYFASTLLHHGVGIKAVSDYLGHSSAAITLGIYAHTMPAAHDQMRQVIDASTQDHGSVTAQAGAK